MMKTLKRNVLITLCAGLISAPLYAHDVWLVPDDGDLKLVYGHPDELETYEPRKLKKVTALDAHGKTVEVSQNVVNGLVRVRPAGEVAMVVLDYDNGYWSNNLNNGWKNVSKQQMPDYKEAMHSVKYGKNLMAWGHAATTPVGTALEMVPLDNPLTAAKGDTLRFKVLYQGKALADAKVEVYGTKDEYKTNGDGVVTIPLPQSGFQHIAAYHKLPLKNDPNADELSLTANVVFTSR